MPGPTRRAAGSAGTRPFGHRVAAVVLGLAVSAAAAGCTSDQEPRAEPSPSATPSETTRPVPPSVPFKVVVTRVHGTVARKDRPALEGNVGRALRGYVDGAFLRGPYPRTDFRAAFGSFTSGAAGRARRDQALLTNATLGRSTESVRAVRRTAYLSVLAPYKVAAGITARVDLVFVVRRTNYPAHRVRLTGRLLLTRDKQNAWVIFGYDLARSDTPLRSAS